MPFIVKVQLSITTTSNFKQMYIYNKDRSVEYEGDASSDVIALMNKQLKKYFRAELVDDPNSPGKKRIQLLEEVTPQNW